MNNPARWASDPTGRYKFRYWDGKQWTQTVSVGDGQTLRDNIPITTGVAAQSQTPASTSFVSKKSGPTLSAARKLSIPYAGRLGEVHVLPGRLKRGVGVVISQSVELGTVGVITQTGERREIDTPTIQSIVSNPMGTRPGRIWWTMRNLPEAHFSASKPHVRQMLDMELANLIRTPNEETIAFGLEMIPFGLADESLTKLGVEPWRIAYEKLRQLPSDSYDRNHLVKLVLALEDCPKEARLAVGIKTRARIAEIISPWPALQNLELALTPIVPRQLNSIVVQATSFSSVIDHLGGDPNKCVHAAIEDPATGVSLEANLFKALEGAEMSTLELPPTVPLAVVDDLIDNGVTVHLQQGWNEVDQRYVMARQRPQDLADEDLEALNFESEMRRRALSGSVEKFGHLLTDDEHFAVAVAQIASASGRVDLQDLDVLGNSLLAEQLRVAIREGDWTELPLSVVEAPGVGQLLVGLTTPDHEPRSMIERDIISKSILGDACDALFEWDWDAAIRIGQRGLTVADDEIVRDELMNVIAAALWVRGKESEALTMLSKALEGNYTLPLVCNAAAVAESLDTKRALKELSRLAKEAPNETMRAIAAERAFAVWQRSTQEEEQLVPPEVVIDALRSLVPLDLPPDRYRNILEILSQHDGEWLAGLANNEFGKRKNSPEVQVYRGRAKGWSEFCQALAIEARKSSHPSWVDDEVDKVGHFVATNLAEHFEDEYLEGAISLAMETLEWSIPFEAVTHIRIAAFTSMAVRNAIDEGEPQEKFIRWFKDAKKRTKELDGTEKKELVELINAAGDELARSFLSHRMDLVNQLIDAFNASLDEARRLGSRGQLDEGAFKLHMREIRKYAKENLDVISSVTPIIHDRELKDIASTLKTDAAELESRAKELST